MFTSALGRSTLYSNNFITDFTFQFLLVLMFTKREFILNLILISSFIFRLISTKHMACRVSDRRISTTNGLIVKTQNYTRIHLNSGKKSMNLLPGEKLRGNRNSWRNYSNLRTIKTKIRRSAWKLYWTGIIRSQNRLKKNILHINQQHQLFNRLEELTRTTYFEILSPMTD